eukprot:5609498-Amphidinium_carterae.1
MQEATWTHWMGNDAADRWVGIALRRHPAITRHDQSIRDLLTMQKKIALTAANIAGTMAKKQQWDYILPKWKKQEPAEYEPRPSRKPVQTRKTQAWKPPAWLQDF